MKAMLILTVILLFSYNAIAVTPSLVTDTVKPWKIPKEEFKSRYGKNDTAKAIIDIWFAKRKAGFIIAPITGAFSLLPGIPFFSDLGRQPVNPNVYAAIIPFFQGLLFGLLALTSAVATWVILKYSRKKLYDFLLQYNSGKPLPDDWKELVEEELQPPLPGEPRIRLKRRT